MKSKTTLYTVISLLLFSSNTFACITGGHYGVNVTITNVGHSDGYTDNGDFSSLYLKEITVKGIEKTIARGTFSILDTNGHQLKMNPITWERENEITRMLSKLSYTDISKDMVECENKKF